MRTKKIRYAGVDIVLNIDPDGSINTAQLAEVETDIFPILSADVKRYCIKLVKQERDDDVYNALERAGNV